jgi:TatD DNase family protein
VSARFVDAHCHLDSERLGVDAAAAVHAARASGVAEIVMAGVDPPGWAAQVALARRFEGVFPVFGVHPQLVPELDEAGLGAMLAGLEQALGGALGMRPVAVGEAGFDRLTAANRAAMGLQEVAFRAQLRLAKRFDLPVVLHLLKSDEAALGVLREEGIPARGGVVHSFSGAKEFALALVKLGLHVSFCGTLAFPQSRRLREAAMAVPLERLLIETDSPDQAPPPFRGTPNRPEHLPLVAEALAAARGMTVPEVARVTSENARRLFALPGGVEGGGEQAVQRNMPS